MPVHSIVRRSRRIISPDVDVAVSQVIAVAETTNVIVSLPLNVIAVPQVTAIANFSTVGTITQVATRAPIRVQRGGNILRWLPGFEPESLPQISAIANTASVGPSISIPVSQATAIAHTSSLFAGVEQPGAAGEAGLIFLFGVGADPINPAIASANNVTVNPIIVVGVTPALATANTTSAIAAESFDRLVAVTQAFATANTTTVGVNKSIVVPQVTAVAGLIGVGLEISLMRITVPQARATARTTSVGITDESIARNRKVINVIRYVG